MKKLAFLLVLSSGCALYFGDDKQPQPNTGTPEADAKQDFDTHVYPVLSANCAGCHVGTQFGPGLDILGDHLDPATMYDAVIEEFVANDCAVFNNELVGKGIHSGPALTGDDISDVIAWLEKEAQALPACEGHR